MPSTYGGHRQARRRRGTPTGRHDARRRGRHRRRLPAVSSRPAPGWPCTRRHRRPRRRCAQPASRLQAASTNCSRNPMSSSTARRKGGRDQQGRVRGGWHQGHFHGGESHALTGHSFVAQANYASALGLVDARRVVQHDIDRSHARGAADSRPAEARARHADPTRVGPVEAHADGIVNTVVPEKVIPSHQGPDACTVHPRSRRRDDRREGRTTPATCTPGGLNSPGRRRAKRCLRHSRRHFPDRVRAFVGRDRGH